MSEHHCHALRCRALCPPRMLMCRAHWERVPADMQREVYRAVKLRGSSIDATWAPWWRAAHKAIAHVAFMEGMPQEKCMAYVAKQMSFAKDLESK